MPFHPQVQAMLDAKAAGRTPPLYTLTVEQARRADLEAVLAAGGDPEPVGSVRELTVPGPGGDQPARLYRPAAADAPGGVLIYFYGGGWTLGSLETSDAICRSLANRAGCRIVSAGYRLAPEARFPAAVEDCYAALEWVAAHAADLGVDPERIAVGGDSAGGNLAAAVALLARDRSGPALRHQLLVYPNTDFLSQSPSMEEFTDPLLFNDKSVRWYRDHYLTDAADALDPRASPLRAPSLAGLPPATVITAEYDPLRDQGEQYAQRLRESGVAVRERRYDGMIHGFFAMAGALDGGRDAQDYAALGLREALGSAA
jgi:acetyl esterase